MDASTLIELPDGKLMFVGRELMNPGSGLTTRDLVVQFNIFFKDRPVTIATVEGRVPGNAYVVYQIHVVDRAVGSELAVYSQAIGAGIPDDIYCNYIVIGMPR